MIKKIKERLKTRLQTTAQSNTYIPGRAHQNQIGSFVDCSDDPMNLTPAADAIIERIYHLKETLPEDKPIAVLMGECHAMPAHIELARLVMQKLSENQDRFTANMEVCHTTWSEIAETEPWPPEYAPLKYNTRAFDPKGRAQLSTYLATSDFVHAPITRLNLYADCLHRDIPTIFNDAAKDKRGLNLDDPLLAEMAEEFSDHPITNIYATRNRVMTRLALEFAQANKAQIIVQSTGLAHLLGVEGTYAEYNHSLFKQFTDAGVAVIPVFPTHRYLDAGLNFLTNEAMEHLSEAVVIDGLDEGLFTDTDSDLEQRHLHALQEKSGISATFHDVTHNREGYIERAYKEASIVFDRFVKKATING